MHQAFAFKAAVLLASLSVPGPQMIVPGRSVGHIHLGEGMGRVYRTLGNSHLSEGAMGHGRDNWQTGGGNELDVASEVNHQGRGPGRVVLQLRVTSPFFLTARGISTRSDLGQIRRGYPGVRLEASYASRNLHRTVFVYDDKQDGIAFEVLDRSDPKAHCVAVVVHKAGLAVTDEYFPIEPYTPLGG